MSDCLVCRSADRHTKQSLTKTNHTRWCINTIRSPDDEHYDNRNMLRGVINKDIKKCVKLVISKEKRQIVWSCLTVRLSSWNIIPSNGRIWSQGLLLKYVPKIQFWLTSHKKYIGKCVWRPECMYRGTDKSLARPTSRCILFDGENISFDASLNIYINSTNIPPIMIINRIYEHQNLLSL